MRYPILCPIPDVTVYGKREVWGKPCRTVRVRHCIQTLTNSRSERYTMYTPLTLHRIGSIPAIHNTSAWKDSSEWAVTEKATRRNTHVTQLHRSDGVDTHNPFMLHHVSATSTSLSAGFTTRNSWCNTQHSAMLTITQYSRTHVWRKNRGPTKTPNGPTLPLLSEALTTLCATIKTTVDWF